MLVETKDLPGGIRTKHVPPASEQRRVRILRENGGEADQERNRNDEHEEHRRCPVFVSWSDDGPQIDRHRRSHRGRERNGKELPDDRIRIDPANGTNRDSEPAQQEQVDQIADNERERDGTPPKDGDNIHMTLKGELV